MEWLTAATAMITAIVRVTATVTGCNGTQTCRWGCEGKAGKLLDESSSCVGWHHARGQEDVSQL